MLYHKCSCGNHKIWFWSRIPLPRFVNRWISAYRQRKFENLLANKMADEIRKEIDADIVKKILATVNEV